ncbi:cobalt-zinc-cadmium efflux system membrane fusion protein [Rhodothalassium salexigens DSM 2132]|uniref:Cobalt-zinc-cadmium efflux system membrane fusion protein n=1 Tax=Rhodothalassium salexigens DSM 2132 TaxID=1188247 RepID=A0A4R2PRV1_RHOSA|nr:efflux RND transporter periplasmic adaptor subunit [Rhodothalassium salexigens]MBB4210313.1 cobalt-zinc-cadmium efflux system membrane fusion protein [Rhodothalassium salexigens DSM 2132]MBK1639222.1 hypothetical protein [Rhodothalassium salexigens DSM 2132]TCP38477.1 cobalt-zinc-cadmium efflux system membrane fusion protein [Rhodothalassium salexigens DSM 2132]
MTIAHTLTNQMPMARVRLARTLAAGLLALGLAPVLGPQEAGAAQEASASTVHLTAGERATLDLQVGPVPAGSARALIEAPASLRFDADRTVRVGPRLPAKVLRVVADLGQRVEAGEVLAWLDSVALGKAKARYLSAAARFEAATAEHDREKRLAAEQISSEAEKLAAHAAFIEARAALDAAREELRLYGLSLDAIAAIEAGGDRPLSRYPLTSPQAGMVQARDAVPGQTLRPDDTPFLVVDTRVLWVVAEVYEKDIPRIAPGQRIDFTGRAVGGRLVAGTVDWVSASLDETTRTVRVRGHLDNSGGRLRDGQFGTARLHTEAAARTALMPVDAVQTLDGQPVVFVPGDTPDAFRAQPVSLGAEAHGRVEIRRGLDPGDRAVLVGAFALKSALTAAGRSAAHSH